MEDVAVEKRVNDDASTLSKICRQQLQLMQLMLAVDFMLPLLNLKVIREEIR